MAAITAEKYLQLTTFTKAGEPKTVPIWIADLGDGTIGFTTDHTSWKVKRIANTPSVELRPSDSRGRAAEGAPVTTGTALVVDGADYERVNAAIKAKYGWQTTAIAAMYRLARIFGRGQVADRGVVVTVDE